MSVVDSDGGSHGSSLPMPSEDSASASRTIAPNGAPLSAVPCPPPASYKVKILNTGSEIDCASGFTLLDAAVAAGLDYPYACASGNCGTCISRLESGTVSTLPRSDASLSAEQAASGHILACRAQPRSDVSVIWLARGRR